jgi:hypothetical protein
MINTADSIEPNATSQIVARCTRLDNLSQPNSHNPRNVDSRKNAASPSIASGAPKMLPTSREYADQFIPNWNSCTSPVTTPMATLITSRVPKNRVSLRYSGFFRRYQTVWSSAAANGFPFRTRLEVSDSRNQRTGTSVETRMSSFGRGEPAPHSYQGWRPAGVRLGWSGRRARPR